MLSIPLAPPDQPGIERFQKIANFGSGASPQVATVQLPSYGIWLVNVVATYINRNHTAHRAALVGWFSFPAAGGANNRLRFSNPIGAMTNSAGGDGSVWSDIVIGTPSATGLVTVTGSWSSGSLSPQLVFMGARVFEASDFDLLLA